MGTMVDPTEPLEPTEGMKNFLGLTQRQQIRDVIRTFSRLEGPTLRKAQENNSRYPDHPAGKVAHWSVQRGDPHPGGPATRERFRQHLTGCATCQLVEEVYRCGA